MVVMHNDVELLHASSSCIYLQTTTVHGVLCPSEHVRGRMEDRRQSEKKQIHAGCQRRSHGGGEMRGGSPTFLQDQF